jgi:hypothetical protein
MKTIRTALLAAFAAWLAPHPVLAQSVSSEVRSIQIKTEEIYHLSLDSSALLIRQVTGNRVGYEKRIEFDTEKKLHLRIHDYNFDGFQDFSVDHTDEGQGTYNVFRIFIFSPTKSEFLEAQPSCGDMFVNVRRDVRHKKILNTYWLDGVPRTCSMRLGEPK